MNRFEGNKNKSDLEALSFAVAVAEFWMFILNNEIGLSWGLDNEHGTFYSSVDYNKASQTHSV